MADRLAGADVGAGQIGGDDALEAGQVDLVGVAGDLEAGVIDQDI
jgi:hypothetical protein